MPAPSGTKASLYHRSMGGNRTIRGQISASPGVARAVRRVVAAWRGLTGEDEAHRRTLVACSGGVDSMALVAALGSASDQLVVGHVVHDLRPRDKALEGRDAARALAGRVGMAFVEAEVSIRGVGGNAESAARSARYEALARLARDSSCRFVATAHHAEDQLETVLMRLLRGAGPRGLGGLARKRRLTWASTEPLWVVRPMLAVGRCDAEDICRATGSAWVEDETNQDPRLLRNALRHRVLPILKELAPRGAEAAVATADMMREIAGLVEREAKVLMGRATPEGEPVRSLRWDREVPRRTEAIVLGEMVRLAAGRLRIERGADKRGFRAMAPVISAMKDDSTDPREFAVGGLMVCVDARAVVIRPLPSGP